MSRDSREQDFWGIQLENNVLWFNTYNTITEMVEKLRSLGVKEIALDEAKPADETEYFKVDFDKHVSIIALYTKSYRYKIHFGLTRTVQCIVIPGEPNLDSILIKGSNINVKETVATMKMLDQREFVDIDGKTKITLNKRSTKFDANIGSMYE